MATIIIDGLTADDKVPGEYAQSVFGTGRVSIGSLPVKVLLLGPKVSGGTATADQDIDQIFSEEDAITLWGRRSLLRQMASAALLASGASVYGAPVAEPAGGTAATATVTIAGDWSAATQAGEVGIRLKGKQYVVAAAPTDSLQTVAERLAAKINEDDNGGLEISAAVGAGPGYVITLTFANLGVIGNDVYFDKISRNLPTGMTLAIAGGSATTSGLVPFVGGAGAYDISNVVDLLESGTYDYIASAFNDATNAAALADHVNSEASSLISHLEYFVLGHNGTLAQATALAQSSLNEQRGQVVWHLYSETHPALIAAEFAARRSVVEPQDPVHVWDDQELVGVAPQYYAADVANHTALKAALNVGVTPLKTVNSAVYVTRSITTKSLNGTTPDYRTLDTYDVVMTDRARKELVATGSAWRTANPHVIPDPAEGAPAPRDGVGTPRLWQSEMEKDLRRMQDDLGWIQRVDDNLPIAYWDYNTSRILSQVDVIAVRGNHQIGISVRQRALSA